MERLKEVRNISALTFICCALASVIHLASNICGCFKLPSSNALLPLLTCIDFHNHPSICSSAEDAAGVVSVKESAAAGPGQCAAFRLLEDPDACGLCSLVLQGFTQVQSMIPEHPLSGREVKGPFLTTWVLTLHAPCRSRHELDLPTCWL